MKFNKIILIGIILLTIFTAGTVSAFDEVDNVTINEIKENQLSSSLSEDDFESDEDNSFVSESQVDVISSNDENIIGKTIKTPGSTFEDIQSKINTAKKGDIISLTGSKYVGDSYDKITVNKEITIQGSSSSKKVVLDGNKSSILYSYKPITLKNIKFINAEYFILNLESGCTLINCEFVNNNGGVMVEPSTLSEVHVEKCIFKNNKNCALDVRNVILNVADCQFTSNACNSRGAAIYISNSTAVIKSSNFTKNTAQDSGGAIYISSSSKHISISDSLFNANKAKRGSALDIEVPSLLSNNVFVNNNADEDIIENIGYFFDTDALIKNNIIKSNLKLNPSLDLSIVPLGNYINDLIEIKVTDLNNNVKYSNKNVSVLKSFSSIYTLDMHEGVTDDNGVARISPVDSEGIYNLWAIADLGDFKVVSSILDVSYKKINAVANPSKLTFSFNSKNSVSIIVSNKDNNNPLPNQKLWIWISGNAVFKEYNVKTDTKGKVSINLPKLNVGKYEFEIMFEGNSDIINLPTSISILKINKAPTKVKAPKVTNKYKKSKYFKVTVKAYNKPLKNVKVKVKVFTGKKSKIYKIKTNKKGVAKLNTKKLSKGNHKVIISSGNNNYKISAKSKITIK